MTCISVISQNTNLLTHTGVFCEYMLIKVENKFFDMFDLFQ